MNWSIAGSKKIYNKIKRNILKQINNSVKNYERNLVNQVKNEPILLYSYIRKKQKVKNHIRALNDNIGSTMYDKHSIVNIFNNYFYSVYIKEENINDCNFEVQTNSRFGKIFVDQALVKSYLSKLDINKSSRYDEVNPYVLKACSESFSIPLSIIYQQSLTNSDIPNLWKMANVSPIFKNESKLQAINYRPVSLTFIPCKVLEKIISDNLKTI
ncbi:uncharacterized protein LOC136072287 [Hydra vulgaris]|uniref:uncharacterized protein LOC136072287 n=1 Tax=Hydra vulgaris TaxID=6087 RepID=UPI0032E9CB6C